MTGAVELVERLIRDTLGVTVTPEQRDVISRAFGERPASPADDPAGEFIAAWEAWAYPAPPLDDDDKMRVRVLLEDYYRARQLALDPYLAALRAAAVDLARKTGAPLEVLFDETHRFREAAPGGKR